MHKLDLDKPFIVAVGNFSKVHSKTLKHTVLGYATQSPKLPIPVASPLAPTFRSPLDTFPLVKTMPSTSPHIWPVHLRSRLNISYSMFGRSCSTNPTHPPQVQ